MKMLRTTKEKTTTEKIAVQREATARMLAAQVPVTAQALDAEEAETVAFWFGLKERDQKHRDRFEAMMAGVRS